MNTSENHLRFRTKELFIGALIGLVFSPLAAYMGYILNDYLSREKLSIANVELVPEVATFADSSGTGPAIFNSDLYRQFAFGNRTTQGLSDQYSTITKGSADEIRGRLRRFERFLLQHEKEMDSLQNILTKKTSGDILVRLISSGVAENPAIYQDVYYHVKNCLAQEKSNAQTIRGKTGQFIAKLEKFPFTRTGKIRMYITLLNTGNTDGLVKSTGELVVVKNSSKVEIAISPYSEDAPSSTSLSVTSAKVEKKSMATYLFLVNSGDLADKDVRTLHELVKKNSTDELIFNLTDVYGRNIQSKKVALPIL